MTTHESKLPLAGFSAPVKLDPAVVNEIHDRCMSAGLDEDQAARFLESVKNVAMRYKILYDSGRLTSPPPKVRRAGITALTESVEALTAGILREDPLLDALDWHLSQAGLADAITDLDVRRLRRKYNSIRTSMLIDLPPAGRVTKKDLQHLPAPCWPLEVIRRRLGPDGLARLRAVMLRDAAAIGRPTAVLRPVMEQLADVFHYHGLAATTAGKKFGAYVNADTTYQCALRAILAAVEGTATAARRHQPVTLLKFTEHVLAAWRKSNHITTTRGRKKK